MRKAEQRLWDTMRRNLLGKAYVERVENALSSGMPDVLVRRERDVWIELKAPHMPVRPSTPLLGEQEGLNPSQLNWHVSWNYWGGISYVLIRPIGHNDILLVPGGFAKTINKSTYDELQGMSYAKNWRGLMAWI